jgi:hypothetical protein
VGFCESGRSIGVVIFWRGASSEIHSPFNVQAGRRLRIGPSRVWSARHADVAHRRDRPADAAEAIARPPSRRVRQRPSTRPRRTRHLLRRQLDLCRPDET